MKNILLTVSSFSVFFISALIPKTNSYFSSSVNVIENRFEADKIVNFYLRADKKAVGFEVLGISEFDSLKYKISYKHNLLDEVVQGAISLSDQNSFKEEWVILGTCSSGGTCVYYDDIDEIFLRLDLLNSGVVEQTLNSTLSLD
ncbi:hypothetical protein A2159_03835 [Candidatus Woesebacteria bacterium RBG_13_34_9]|uniref:Uncharacterized protein n=1 Tax=Candidatus Woesebacteria bacterium RBG_13_34_9 TaxID=1802477 RepID=A0A1F7X106_9BACT|nr:MAG: hypothetical protein A2159_03835 [Candidatus Woesebacteria bacterium RBG_13_34_9]